MTIKSFDKIDIECFITFCIKIKGNELEISHEDFVEKVHTASEEYLTFKKYTGNGMVCNLKTLA